MFPVCLLNFNKRRAKKRVRSSWKISWGYELSLFEYCMPPSSSSWPTWSYTGFWHSCYRVLYHYDHTIYSLLEGIQSTEKTITMSCIAVAAAAKSLQSCLILFDPIDGSPPGSPVPGILQARTLEWVAISFSNARKWNWDWSHSVMSDSEQQHGLQPTRLLHPWDFPGKGTGVGCHCLLQWVALGESKSLGGIKCLWFPMWF